jgi:hypothetical protein
MTMPRRSSSTVGATDRRPGSGLLVLSLLVVTTTACNRMDVAFSATGPAPLTAKVNLGSSFDVEPSIVRPEILPGSCGTHSPFGVRLGVVIRGGEDFILRSVRFSFEDRFGTRALPDVMPIPSLSSPLPTGAALPSSSPVTVPGIAPLPAVTSIPIPGGSPVTGMLVPGGSHASLHFFIRFGCGIASRGAILIVIDAADRHGRFETSELRVPLGS